MAKEGYKPTAGMQSAARRAIKLKEQGKAKGAGTAVGWTRAGQLARGETLSLSTVKRMYSFFSRHEVDKKGKDWSNSENPSNGKIMWLAWGGDAGFSWSRKIVEREKNKMKKSYDSNEIIEEVKDMLDDVVNPIDTVVEIEDDQEIQKALRAEVTREQMAAVVEHLMEAIESMIEMPEEDDAEAEAETPEMPNMPEMEDKMQGQTDLDIERELGIYKSDNEDEDKWDNEMQKCWTGYKQEGMKDKGGRMVPNCVPVEKAHDVEAQEEVKKSLWGGYFSPDLKK